MPQKWSRIFLLLFLTRNLGSEGIKGPPKLHHQSQLVTAEEGNPIKISCPITGNPEPLFEWTKDERTVDETWPRYVLRRHFLRIKSAREEDAGEFRCTGVNGFGQESFTFSLLIYKEDLPPMDAQTPPIFTEVSPSSPFITSVGDVLTLMCKADGIPPPKISWKKDGALLHKSGSKLHRPIQSILDTGIYTCGATNPLAIVTHNFSIIVEEKSYDEPEILQATNASVVQGSNATLQCIVKSFLVPEIQWLKLVTPSEAASLPRTSSNKTLHRNGQTYRYISTLSSRIERVNGTFISTLYIQGASPSHAGVYVCVGATRNGYNYKEVHLSITSDVIKSRAEIENELNLRPASKDDRNDDLRSHLLIAVVPVIALLLVTFLVVLIYKMRIRHSRLRKSHPSGNQNPSLETEEQKMGTPLHSYFQTKVVHNMPPDLVYQDGSSYTTRLSNMGPVNGSIQYDDSYFYPENSYLEPNYSDPYFEPQDQELEPTNVGKGFETRSSDHSYARLTHSTQSSTSPLPPPPYGYQLPFSPSNSYKYRTQSSFTYAPPQVPHRNTKYVVHYNL